MRWFALFLILCGCSVRPNQDLDVAFAEARGSLQAGDLDPALRQGDNGLRLAAARHDLKHEWQFRLLRCEILAFNRRPEEMLSSLADPIPPDPAFAVLAARKLMIEGQAQALLSHLEKANDLFSQAHRAAEALNAQELLAEIEIQQGPVLQKIYGTVQGERLLFEALERAKGVHSRFLQANILLNLGSIRSRNNRWEEAASLYEQSVSVADPRWKVLYSVAQSALGIAYQNLGEYDRAIAIQKEAIAHDERTGAKKYLLIALRSIGETYLNKDELREAIPYLERALSLAGEIGSDSDAAIAAGNLCAVYIELGDWKNAETLNQTALRFKKSAKLNTTYYNLGYAADIAAGSGDPARAVQLYRQAIVEGKDDPTVLQDAHKGLGMVAWRGHDTAGAAREFETAIELIEKARSEVVRTEFKLPFLAGGIRLYRSYVDLLLEQGQPERALAVADSSRAQVLAEHSGAGPIRRLPPGAYSRLARNSGAVLVSYWLAPTRSHVWVVTPREVHHVPLSGAPEIETLVAQYRGAIERQLADPLRTRIPAGEKLYQMLVAPVRPYLPAGARVLLLPDGVLHSINFETLTVPGEPARYLIQDLTFETVPSLSAASTAPAKPSPTGLLLLGDPVLDDHTLPPLAAASREITGVRQHFAPSDQVVLTRDSATPQAFVAAAKSPFAMIHFTAHALANLERPLESAVLLSRGKLYARDVMDLPLSADLVTLSVCHGAGQRTYSGEGLVGFAWAFLRAGARNVIAGLWDVNDQSTAGFMDAMYGELAAGKRPAEALRAAKLAMIESKGNLKKPYYWAPFQLYTVAP
jgi:CHAT domain-containing protein/tetratricopeptide (TPR) repeat protein